MSWDEEEWEGREREGVEREMMVKIVRNCIFIDLIDCESVLSLLRKALLVMEKRRRYIYQYFNIVTPTTPKKVLEYIHFKRGNTSYANSSIGQSDLRRRNL